MTDQMTGQMTGEMDLQILLSSCQATMADDEFVFICLADRKIPSGLSPVMMFQEAEAMSLIITRQQAEAAGLSFVYPCRMITLAIHSSLEAVGFMAHIARLLADAGISVNPVAGFYHDHLFVPVTKADEAMALLSALDEKNK